MQEAEATILYPYLYSKQFKKKIEKVNHVVLYSVNMCDLIIMCKIALKASTDSNRWSIMKFNWFPITSDIDYSLCSGMDPGCAKVHVGFSDQKALSTNQTQSRDLEALRKSRCCFWFLSKVKLASGTGTWVQYRPFKASCYQIILPVTFDLHLKKLNTVLLMVHYSGSRYQGPLGPLVTFCIFMCPLSHSRSSSPSFKWHILTWRGLI